MKLNQTSKYRNKMKQRIQINGIWYVAETQRPVEPVESIDPNTVVVSIERVWETGDWCFEATVIMRDNAETLDDHYPDPMITITDKRPGYREDWVTHNNMDNPIWMLGVYEGNPESMSEAEEMMDDDGIYQFRQFLGHLIECGWLVKKQN
jgi:hypothetical protein